MGQTQPKMVEPEDGNVENEQILEQRQKRRFSLFQKKKVVLNVNDQQLFGETDPTSSWPTPQLHEAEKETKDKEEEHTVQEEEEDQTEQDIEKEKEKEKETETEDVAEDKEDAKESEEEHAEEEHTEQEQEEEEKSAFVAGLEKSRYAVNYEHVKEKVAEFTDSIKATDEHSGHKLLDIFDKLDIKSADLTMWKGDYGSTISSKQDARHKMKSVIDFAETNGQCTPEVKQRLRVITKLILESPNKEHANYLGILLLIASHGNVCNVMKEVAINDAYGIMTGSLEDMIRSQSLKEQILRVLRDYRVLMVEELFHWFKFTNNTHYIAGFHNTLAPKIGVTPYNDPNICYPSSSQHAQWREHLDQRYFAEFYTLEKILNHILIQIDGKKIGYQRVVGFFEQHCPADMDKTQFLQMAIDIDTGKISENAMCWLLQQMDIFLVKGDEWKDIEKCWQ